MSWLPEDDALDESRPGLQQLQAGLGRLDALLGVMVSAAEGKSLNQSVYGQDRRRLNSLLGGLEVPSPLVWKTLQDWAAYTKSTFPHWRERRERAQEIITQIRAALEHAIEMGTLTQDLHDLGAAADRSVEDTAGISAELARLPGLLATDLPAAVGKARNLVEATAKVVAAARGRTVPEHHFDKLTSAALRALDLDPDPHGTSLEAGEVRLLKELTRFAGLLRNAHGDAHGVLRPSVELRPRQARLAVRAAVAWCHFVLETLQDLRDAEG